MQALISYNGNASRTAKVPGSHLADHKKCCLITSHGLKIVAPGLTGIVTILVQSHIVLVSDVANTQKILKIRATNMVNNVDVLSTKVLVPCTVDVGFHP